MTKDSKRLWRNHLPFHSLFLAVALIGYFKAGTAIGFWIVAASLGLTAVIDLMSRRARRNADPDAERKEESRSTHV